MYRHRQLSRFVFNKLKNNHILKHSLHTTSVLGGGNLTKTIERNGVREIQLNDPKTRHSLSINMMDELHDEICRDINNNNLRVIVLSSSGPVWCAGHNLKELGPNTDSDQHRKIFKKLIDIIMTIHQAPVPVIAKIDGLATAGGCQLAASCDIVIGSERCSFQLAGANAGIFCSTPGVAVTRVMPKMKSAFMLFTGLPINGNDAYIAGLVSHLASNDKLDEEVDKVCQAIVGKSRSIIKLGKEFYYKQLGMNIREAYIIAEETMVKNLIHQDGKEGVQSFIEKRKPKWTHS